MSISSKAPERSYSEMRPNFKIAAEWFPNYQTQRTIAAAKKNFAFDQFLYPLIERSWKEGDVSMVQSLVEAQPPYTDFEIRELSNALEKNDSERLVKLIRNIPFPSQILKEVSDTLLDKNETRLMNKIFFYSWRQRTNETRQEDLHTFIAAANANEAEATSNCNPALLELWTSDALSIGLPHLSSYLKLLKSSYHPYLAHFMPLNPAPINKNASFKELIRPKPRRISDELFLAPPFISKNTAFHPSTNICKEPSKKTPTKVGSKGACSLTYSETLLNPNAREWNPPKK